MVQIQNLERKETKLGLIFFRLLLCFRYLTLSVKLNHANPRLNLRICFLHLIPFYCQNGVKHKKNLHIIVMF